MKTSIFFWGRSNFFSVFFTLLLVLNFFSVMNVSSQSTNEFKLNGDTLVVYSGVPGLTPSNKYTIRVKSAATNNEWVDVFANYTYNRAEELGGVPIPMLDGTTLNTTVMHYALQTSDWSHAYGNIEMNNGQTVEVEIAAKNGFKIGGQDFFKATVHPAQKASAATLVGGKIYFTITKPGQLYIDINGQMDDYNEAINPIGHPIHAISLFANPVIKKPSLTGLRVHYVEPGLDSAALRQINPDTYDTLYFKPGVHNVCKDFKVYPGKTIYIPGDAIFYGNISNYGVPQGIYSKNGADITIYGYGTISGAKIPHYNYVPNVGAFKALSFENDINCKLYGITLVDPASHSIELNGDNYPMRWLKTITWRANGDGLGGYTDAEDCFIRTQDDCSYVKANRIRCTLWKDANANLFYMATTPENTITPIILEDCDVLYARLRTNPGTNGGGFSAGGGSGLIGQRKVNVIVRNFRFHDKLINMSVFNLRSETGSSFDGVLFQNISIAGMASGNKQKIIGSAASPWYGGVIFDNVTINDTLLTNLNFSNFFTTNEYVSGVICQNSLNYTLTINNSDTGTVVSSSSLPYYADSTVITLTANPKAGYAFKSWSGDVSGNTNPTTFAITSNMVVSANYQRANSYTSSTPGSGSWIVPTGVDSITINVWGAGGAGGSAQVTATTTANTQVRGGGGSGGSYAGLKIAVTPGQIISYTVGAGAIAPVSGFANDVVGNGGNTSCGTTIAVGGIGGQSKTTAVAGYSSGTGGIAPITGNTGTVKFYGGNGGNASSSGTGGGGGSAGSTGNGGNSTNNIAGIAGAGGGAAGAAGQNISLGYNGFVPGSGGSGSAIRASSGTTPGFQIGGRGGNGKLLITYTINQTITFPAIATKTVGDADFNAGATASSGLAVTYTSSNTAVATIVNGNIHIVGVGTADITASQSGDTTYNAAPSVVQSLNIIVQGPYLGSNRTIPGVIEGEHYDEGGQGVAYGDDAAKQGSASYRPSDKVDVVAKTGSSNGFTVGFTLSGEWLEYTVNATPGIYDINLKYYCGSTPVGDLKVSLDGVELTTITEIFSQGSFNTQASAIVENLNVSGGSNQVLRLEFVNGGKFDIDAIEFILNHQISLAVNGGVGGTVSGDGTFSQGQSITVTAIPAVDYSFVNWTENGVTVSTDTSYTFAVTQARNLVANFAAITYPDVTALTSWVSETTNNKVAGSKRLMTVMVMGESKANFIANTVTYGGQVMVKQTEKMYYVKSNRTYASIFTLNETGVNAATSGTIAVTWSATPSVGSSIYSVLLSNVDQTTPVSASANNALTGTSITTAALAAATGDMVVMCGATENDITQTFDNGFTKQFESNTIWGDGVGGYKMGTGASEIPKYTQSGSGRMVICAMVIKKAASAPLNISKGNTIIDNVTPVDKLTTASVSVYPNPVSNVLNINFPDNQINRTIKIFNATGQMIYNSKTKDSENEISIQALNVKGLIMVQVETDNTILSYKTIVN